LLALAGILVLVAAVIAIGVVGGYVVFRGGGALPAAAATFAPGERLPVGVTGALRAPSGLVHVREAPADVVRFVVAAPVASEAEAGAPTPDPAPEATDPAPEATDSEPVWPAPVPPASEPMPAADAPPTMIVERQGRAEGVAVGRGELEGIESGTVATFRARRPALRLRAGTGRLVISFPNEDARDRVAAELAVETAAGLTAETAAGPAAEPAPIEEDR
jgi:hypothetical protein